MKTFFTRFVLAALVVLHQQCVLAAIGSYTVEIITIGTMDPNYVTVINQAAAKWQSVVTGTHTSATAQATAGTQLCQGEPDTVLTQDKTWQDLIIYVKIHPIDGVGRILGHVADAAMLYEAGQLQSTVEHEMGHLHGIGITWNMYHLIKRKKFRYYGQGGITGNLAIGRQGKPIIENKGGPGTARSHWRETTYGSELMTGWLSGPSQPLTALTGDSLIDLGYFVDPNGFDAPTNLLRGSKPTGSPPPVAIQYHTGKEKRRPRPIIVKTVPM